MIREIKVLLWIEAAILTGLVIGSIVWHVWLHWRGGAM